MRWSAFVTDGERLAALEREQAELRDRLARVEAALKLRLKPAPAPPRPAAPAPERPRFETRLGLTWINRVGVVTLVLGVAFFFKYAVEAGWIGEWARVLLGAAAGLAALAVGERAWRGGQQVWAQGVSASGIGILYVSFYSAAGLYHLVPQGAAFLLLALVTAASVALATRYGSQALAALGLLGGCVTPVALGGAERAPWFALGYVLLLDAGALYVARRRGWQALEALALAGTVWLYLSVVNGKPERHLGDTIFVLAYYALFAAGRLRWIFIPAQLLAALALAGIWPSDHALFFPLAIGLAIAGLATAERLGWPLAPMAGFWLSYWAWHEGHKRPPLETFAFATVAFAAISAWAPWRLWKRGARAGIQDLLLVALNAGAYFASGYALLTPEYHAYAGIFAAMLAAAHAALAYFAWNADPRLAVLAAGVAWALAVLAAPAQFSGYRITMVWALEAAALAWIGARLRERRAGWGALAVFVLVLARLGLLDARMAHARILTFGVAAACLMAAAWWLPRGPQALAAYLAGQFVALWGLSLEALDWAGRVATAANLASVESTSLSILWAGWAVLLVSVGVAARSAPNRIMGLALIAAVVAKLYLYDVWFLGLFYRMAAFAVLGALLLAMSYLYSRFRVSIENWWRDRRA